MTCLGRPSEPSLIRRKLTEVAVGLYAAPAYLTRQVLPDWRPPPVPVYILTESRLQPARVRLFLDHLVRQIDL